MPRAEDHPLRLARLRRGITVSKLAELAAVNRTTLDAIEEGRTKRPSPATVEALERALKLPSPFLQKQIDDWFTAGNGSRKRLSLKAKALLDLPPHVIGQYRSFEHWRHDVAGSPTAFASLVGVPRETVSAYEKGVRVNGMPQSLSSAILRSFDVSDAYLLELQKLDPSDE